MNTLIESEIADVPDIGGEALPDDKTAGTLKPLTIWRPSQFLEWTEPAGNHLLLPAYLTKGELTTLIGQGGLGKTRLALWLAICQITGRKWCGLDTAGEPQKWLLLGDENSIARIKGDLQRILSNLSPSECVKVDEFLRLHAVLSLEDADLNLGDAVTQARVALTVETESPGGIVADPLVNFAPGDISKPGEMKEAIRLLASTIRKAAPNAALVLLHHARTGRANIAQGIGWNAANFATGGKPLFAAARCQMNLMPGKSEDDTRLVLSCAKANNCQRFETRGLVFDPQRFTYTVDQDFDSDTWLADVEGRRTAGSSLCTVREVVSAVQDGYSTTKALVEHLCDAYQTSKSTVERLIKRAVEGQGIATLTRGQFTIGKHSARFLEAKT